MSLQTVTVKEIEKERNKRYDTSDRGFYPGNSWGIFPPQISEIPPRISGLSLFLCGWENE